MSRNAGVSRPVVRAFPVKLSEIGKSIGAACASGEASFVEMVVASLDVMRPRDEWERIRRDLASARLTCSGLALESEDGIVLAAADASARSRARERISAALNRAHWIGASFVRVAVAQSPAGVEKTPRHEDAYHHTLEALTALRHEAALIGVRIAVTVGPGGFPASLLEARSFLDAVNSPWVGAAIVLADRLAVEQAVDWIETLAHRLYVVAGIGASGEREAEVIDRALADMWFDGVVVASPVE